jgi:hypothetical protein
MAGELGAAYAIPIIYVPLLMITHFAAFYLLVRPSGRQTAEQGGPTDTALIAKFDRGL